MPLHPAFSLALALVTPGHAHDTVVTAPLHAPGGDVVGQLEGALATTIHFRDGTRAEVAFTTSEVEIRGEISLDEGEVVVRPTERTVLDGWPFQVEVEPGVELRLVDGRRQEVELGTGPLVAGLAATRLRLGSEAQVMPEGTVPQVCQPVFLWAEPRVAGPIVRTLPPVALAHAPAKGAPGWSEVWVTERGVWLRGYTWEVLRCGAGRGWGSGRGTERVRAVETRELSAGTTIAQSGTAPWTVRVLVDTEVDVVERAGRRYFVFPLTEGRARVEGVVAP